MQKTIWKCLDKEKFVKKSFFYTKLLGKDETLPTVVFARSSRIYDHLRIKILELGSQINITI